MKIVRYVLAVIVGMFAGGFVNIATLTLGQMVIPAPPGADLSTPEGWKAAANLVELKHYVPPFFAHAFGTFVSAFVATLIAPAHKLKLAIGMGVLGLVGGITAAFMIPAPAWFIVLDLVVAYLPVAFVASKLASSFSKTADRSDVNV